MDTIGGRHRLFVNSQRYYLKGDPTYDVGGLRKHRHQYGRWCDFHKEEYVNCKVSGTLAFTPSLDLVALRKTKKATVMLGMPERTNYRFPGCVLCG